jgi:hypothetical protein
VLLPLLFTVQSLVTPDGAWCWFQDERAVISGQTLYVGSISSQGDIQVSSHSLTSNYSKTDVLHSRLEQDDHDSPALLQRSDGKLMAFYSKHGPDNLMRFRTLGSAGWESERTYTAGLGPGFTYANPFQLGRRLLNFWRGAWWNPTLAVSNDFGKSWSQGKRIIISEGHRPYVKYASNHRDRIDLAFTEAHPQEYWLKEGRATAIYHAYYQGGLLHGSDGSFRGETLTPSQATRVYSGNDPAWIWDVAFETNRPRLAFSALADPREPRRDHRYFYSSFDGSRWKTEEIAFAGTGLYDNEPYYSGGIALDPDEPGVVYASANADPTTGAPTPHYEIYRGEKTGSRWRWVAVTRDSAEDQLRPIVPERHPDGVFVLWMRGRYTSYVDYRTGIVLARGTGK